MQELKAEIERLRLVGEQMSNACFNLSQHEVIHQEDQLSLAKLVREWDKIRRTTR